MVDLPVVAPPTPPVTPPVTLPVAVVAEPPATCEPPSPSVSPPAPSRPPRRLPVLRHESLLWTDVAACEMRRAIVDALWSEHVEIDLAKSPAASGGHKVTRDQRAHRRATWTERLARNDLGPGAVLLTLHVYGVSDALAGLVGLTISASFAEVKTLQAHGNPEGPVATT